jgi:hypothetical protein
MGLFCIAFRFDFYRISVSIRREADCVSFFLSLI